MEQSLRRHPRLPWNTRRNALGVLLLVAACLTLVFLIFGLSRPGRREGRVEALLRSGKSEAALQEANALESQGRGPSQAAYLRARALFALGRDRDCEEALDQAVVRGFDGALVDRLRGFLRLRQKRYAEAEPLLVGAMSRRESVADPELDEALARVFLQTYKMELASRVLARWRSDAPDDPRPYLWQTEVDRRTGAEPSVIVEHCREALARDPSSLHARLALADALSETKQHPAAEAEYRAYLAEKPQDVAVLIRAARNDIERGDEASAVRRLAEALRLNPGSGPALRERARIDLRANRLEDAIAGLDRAVVVDPFEVDGRYARSLVLDRLGRTEEANAERILVNLLREDEVRLEEYRSAVNRNPRDTRARLGIARWMFAHSQGNEGVRWVETILADDPTNGEAHRLLADHLAKAGQPALANFHRLQASTAEPTDTPPTHP